MRKIFKISFPLFIGLIAFVGFTSCSDSDNQPFAVVAADGYILQTYIEADGSPSFVPYIYFAANEKVTSKSHISHDMGSGDGELIPGYVCVDGNYHETDWKNTEPRNELDAVSGIYTISAANESQQLASHYIDLTMDKAMGYMDEIEFTYTPPSGGNPAMVSAHVANVENATVYALTLMPYTEEYGYTRMKMPQREFEPDLSSGEQLLVWSISPEITETYDMALMCITAKRYASARPVTRLPGITRIETLVLEGQYREIDLSREYKWTEEE